VQYSKNEEIEKGSLPLQTHGWFDFPPKEVVEADGFNIEDMKIELTIGDGRDLEILAHSCWEDCKEPGELPDIPADQVFDDLRWS
jgi:hypothetical protein